MQLPQWLVGNSRRKSGRGSRSSARQHRLGLAVRALGLETLEDRALLSVSPGLTATSALVGQQQQSVAASQYAVLLSPRVQSGMATTVELFAMNAANRPAWSYSGTASLSSSDTAATLPATVTFQNGVATFQATFATAGPQTITASDSSTSSITGKGTTSVVAPAVASAYYVQMPWKVQSGVATTVQMYAVDGFGRLANTYSGTARLSSSDTGATLPATVTFANGVATFQATFATAGPQTITATDNTTASITGKGNTTVLAPAVASAYTVQLPFKVQSGVATKVQVYAVDSSGRLVNTYSGTARLSSSDTAATLPATVTFANGVATFQATFATAGPQTITATDSSTASITGKGNTTVSAPAVALKLSVLAPSSAQTGSAMTVQLQAVDANNRVVTTFNDTANLASSDKSATLPGTVTFVNGVATFQVTFATLGSQTVTATDATNASLTGAATVNVVAPGTTTPPTSTTSTNWSGYAAETSLSNPQSNSVSYVAGTWNVPTVSGSGTAYSSVWVGIDGYGSNTVEQLGTEQDLVNGRPVYSAWYEMYPAYPVDINMTIQPGDSITASVTYQTSGAHSGQFQLAITDSTRAETFTTYQSAPGAQRSSAEWVVEAPSSNRGVLPLANFGTVAFSGAQAIINGTAGAIDNAAWQSAKINMQSGATVEDVTSGLTDTVGTSNFSVKYGTSGAAVAANSAASGLGGLLRANLAATDQFFDALDRFDF